MAGSRQHLTCSFMPTCLRCRTLVDANVLLYQVLYVLCCSVQGRLEAVLLWISELVYAVPTKEEKQVEKQKLRGCSELMIQLALSKKSTPPAVMLISRLALPSAMTWTEKSTTCVANLPRSQQHTRALPAAIDLVLLLYYCGWLWCCYNYTTNCCLALSSLVTCNEKTKEKNEKKGGKKKVKHEFLWIRKGKKPKTDTRIVLVLGAGKTRNNEKTKKRDKSKKK